MMKNSRGRTARESSTVFGQTASGFRAFFMAIVVFTVFSETITGTSAMKRSVKIQHPPKTSREVAESSKDSKTALNDGESNVKVDRRLVSNPDLRTTENNRDNSPALNTFLENVLRAQNELKWIDQAVRHVGVKDSQDMYAPRSSRYMEAPLQRPAPIYQARIRSKRESDADSDSDNSWDSQKKKYDDYGNAPQRVYLDEEMKFKRGVDQADFEDRGTDNSKRNEERYDRSVYNKPAIDDSTLKDWARQEGLHLPGDWLNSDRDLRKDEDGLQDQWLGNDYDAALKGHPKSGQIDEFSKSIDDWVDNASENRVFRGQRQAVTHNRASRRKNEIPPEDLAVKDTKIEESPTLESLKKTVLELSKSLEENDKRIDEANSKENASEAKDHERHVEEISGRKEGRAKGEHERDMSSNMAKDSEKSERLMRSASNWWDDPRSAADMFDFKRRDDDMEDEDEDEENDSANSELDYIMRRVKRAKDDSGDSGDSGDIGDDKTVRMYHRAGFGESFPDGVESAESYQRRKRNEDSTDEAGIGYFEGNYVPKISAYRNVVRQIREATVDKNNERLEDRSYQDTKKRNVNANEHPGEKFVRTHEHEASRGADNSVNEESPENISGEGNKQRETRKGDIGTKEGRNTGIKDEEAIPDKDKRSASSKANRDERKQRLSADVIPDEKSSTNSKTKLDESLKTAPMEPPAEAAAHWKLDGPIEKQEDSGKEYNDKKFENEGGPVEQNDGEKASPGKGDTEQKDKKEVEKSEPMDDDVHKKLSNELPDEKKDQDQDQKDVWHEPENGERVERLTDHNGKQPDKQIAHSEKVMSPHPAKQEEIVTKAYRMEGKLVPENKTPDDDQSKLISTIFNVKEQTEKLESPKITEDSHTKEESSEEDKLKLREVSNIQDRKENKVVSNPEETPHQSDSELKNYVIRGEAQAVVKLEDHEKLKEQEAKNEQLIGSHREDNVKLHGRDEPSTVEEKDVLASKSNSAVFAKVDDETKRAESGNRDNPEHLQSAGWYSDLKQGLQEGHKEPAWYKEFSHNEVDKGPNENGKREDDKRYNDEKYNDGGRMSKSAGSNYQEGNIGKSELTSNVRYDDNYKHPVDSYNDGTLDTNSYADKRENSEHHNDKPTAKEGYYSEGKDKNALKTEDKVGDDERRQKYDDDNYEDDKRLIKYSDKENQKYHSSSSSEYDGDAINSDTSEGDDHQNSRWIQNNSRFKETDENPGEKVRRDVRSDEMRRKLLWAPEDKEDTERFEIQSRRKDSALDPKELGKTDEKGANVNENMKQSEYKDTNVNKIGEQNDKLEDSGKSSEEKDLKQMSFGRVIDSFVEDENVVSNEANLDEKSKSVKRSPLDTNKPDDKLLVPTGKRRRAVKELKVTDESKSPVIERRSVKKDATSESKNSIDVQFPLTECNSQSAKLQKRSLDKYDINQNDGDADKIAMAYGQTNTGFDGARENMFPDSLGKRSPVYIKGPGNEDEDYDIADDEFKYYDEGDGENEEDPVDLGDELSAGDRLTRSMVQEGGRDPLKDKVNMLIRQRIDGKGKGKSAHSRRRRRPVAALEYYDYDSEVGEGEQDSPVIDNDQQTKEEQSSSAAEGERGKKEAGAAAAPSSTAASTASVAPGGAPQCGGKGAKAKKKDEHIEEENKQEKAVEKLKNKHPKQEFVSDVELGKAHKKKKATTTTAKSVGNGSGGGTGTGCGKTRFSSEDNKRLNERIRKVYVGDGRELQGGAADDSRIHWLGQPQEADGREMPRQDRPDRLSKEHGRVMGSEDNRIMPDPLEYNIEAHRRIEPETMGDFLGDDQPGKLIDRDRESDPSRNPYEAYEGRRRDDHYRYGEESDERRRSNIRPNYEEFEKVNDWKGGDVRERPRLRGDQRMYHESRGDTEYRRGRNEGRRNWYPREPDRVEQVSIGRGGADGALSREEDYGEQVLKGRRFLKEAKDYGLVRGPSLIAEPVRDSLPTLLDRSGSVDTNDRERTYLVISPVQSESPDNQNPDSTSSSGSNYLALKITDDMFKGGIEQSNPAEDKPQDLMLPCHTTTEWKVIKLVDTKASPLIGIAGLLPPPVEQRKEDIVLTDSHSPYETRKNFEAPVPEEGNEEMNHEKQTALSSKDIMHESFVESLDWGGELDADTRIRFGRGLKSIQRPVIQFHDFSTAGDLRQAIELAPDRINGPYATTNRNVSDARNQIRFGRHLQSISFPTEPYDRIRVKREADEIDWEAEEPPAQKYLRNTQSGFGREKVVKHWVIKRSLAEDQEINRMNSINIQDGHNNDDGTMDGVKHSSAVENEDGIEAEKDEDTNSGRRDLNKERIDARNDAKRDSGLFDFQKQQRAEGPNMFTAQEAIKGDQRSMDLGSMADSAYDNNKKETVKNKRGLTNVEEWEMNTPIVQKQHIAQANEQNKENSPDNKENVSGITDHRQETKTVEATNTNGDNKFRTNLALTKRNERYKRDDRERSSESHKSDRVARTESGDKDANREMIIGLRLHNFEPKLRSNVETEDPEFYSENADEVQRTRRNAKSYKKHYSIAPKQEDTNEYSSSWSTNENTNYASEHSGSRRSPDSNWNSDYRTNKDHTAVHRSPNHNWHSNPIKESDSDDAYREPGSNWKDNTAYNNWQDDSESHVQENYRKTVRSSGSNKKSKDDKGKEKRLHSSKEEKEEEAEDSDEKSPDARAFSTKRHHRRHPSSPKSTSSQVVRSSNVTSKGVKEHGSRANSKDALNSPIIGKPQGNTANVEGLRQDANSDDALAHSPILAAVDEEKKVLHENANEQSTAMPREEENAKKKFTVLLAADNMEDESQMDLALHGELAGKIVERIFEQVQRNEALKVALGPGLYRKHKPVDAILSDKIYRQGLDEDEVKHTEAMMRRVMELLGRLILDEVQRKTCASLPPDMRDFLQWMLGVEQDEGLGDQAPPLPLVHNKETPHRQDDKFLFEDPSQHTNVDVEELYKKVRLLKSLINEYNSLTTKEKTRVQTVHDYLVRQLGLLVKYIEAKESEETKKKEAAASLTAGNILQYQNEVHGNGSGIVAPMPTLSPLVNTPSILRLSNSSFSGGNGGSSYAAPAHSQSRRREVRSSGREPRRHHRKHKHHKRRHRKHRKHKHDNQQTPEYNKLVRRVAVLRQKRANLYEDQWDPFDTGYEEPTIYSSSGELTNGSSKRKRAYWDKPAEVFGDKTKEDEYENRKNNPYFWADVLSGKLDDDNEFSSKDSTYKDRKERRAKTKKPGYHDTLSGNTNAILSNQDDEIRFGEGSQRGTKLRPESYSYEYGFNSKLNGDNENDFDGIHGRMDDTQEDIGESSDDSLWNTPNQAQTQMETDFDLKPTDNENTDFDFETLDKNEGSELAYPGQGASRIFMDYSKKKREVAGMETDKNLAESNPSDAKSKFRTENSNMNGKVFGNSEDIKELSNQPLRSVSDNLRSYAAQNEDFPDLYSSLQNSALRSDENKKSPETKRDVLSASISLQPWLNPQKDDVVSSEFLKELTDQLIHTPNKVSTSARGNTDENMQSIDKKRDLSNKFQQELVPVKSDSTQGQGSADSRQSGSSIKGRTLADDEVMLLNKREAWKNENEQQLEEVAFGRDMRGKWKEKEQFEKLTEMDKKKAVDEVSKRRKREDDDEISKEPGDKFEERGSDANKLNTVKEKVSKRKSVSDESDTKRSTAKLEETKDAVTDKQGQPKNDAKVSDDRVIKDVQIFEISPLKADHNENDEYKVNVYADDVVASKREADHDRKAKVRNDRKVDEDKSEDVHSETDKDNLKEKKMKPPDNDEKVHETRSSSMETAVDVGKICNKEEAVKSLSESSDVDHFEESKLNPGSNNKEEKRDTTPAEERENKDDPKASEKLEELVDGKDIFKRDVSTDHSVKEYEQRRLDNLGKPMENLAAEEVRKDKRSLDKRQFREIEENGWRSRHDEDAVLESKMAKVKPEQGLTSYGNDKSRNRERSLNGLHYDDCRTLAGMNEDKHPMVKDLGYNYKVDGTSRNALAYLLPPALSTSDNRKNTEASDDRQRNSDRAYETSKVDDQMHNLNVGNIRRGKIVSGNDYFVVNPNSYEGSDHHMHQAYNDHERNNIKFVDKNKELDRDDNYRYVDGLVQKNLLEGNLNWGEDGRQFKGDVESPERFAAEKDQNPNVVEDFFDANGNQGIELGESSRKRRDEGVEGRRHNSFATVNVQQGVEKPVLNPDIAKLQEKTIAKRADEMKHDTPFAERAIDLLTKDKIRAHSGFLKDSGGSAILPLLEVSEQRQMQNQAARTQKDDQRDISDQMLGFESPLIVSLNTF